MRSVVGLERGTVRLVPYDSCWPALFAEEAARIRHVVGADLHAIAHIGSTAVPGMSAKPVIDLMLAIPSLRAPYSLYEALQQIGYDHRPADSLPDRLFFAKDSSIGRTHNLSVCESASHFWFAHLRFRDSLRSDRTLAQSYVALKQALAAQFPNDRLAYTAAKNDFVANAINRGASGA